jgi:hypothetical protein
LQNDRADIRAENHCKNPGIFGDFDGDLIGKYSGASK